MSDRNNTEVVPYTTAHGAGLNRHQISDFRRQMSDIRPQISDKRTNLADFRRPSPLYRGAGLAPAEKPRSKKESPLIRGRHIWRPPSNYSTIAKPSLNYCSATVHPSYPYRFSIASPRLLRRHPPYRNIASTQRLAARRTSSSNTMISPASPRKQAYTSATEVRFMSGHNNFSGHR